MGIEKNPHLSQRKVTAGTLFFGPVLFLKTAIFTETDASHKFDISAIKAATKGYFSEFMLM